MQEEKRTSLEGFKINGNWDNSSKQLREQNSSLTEQDVKLEQGKESELLSRIGNRLGKNKEEVIAMINAVQQKN